MTARNARRLAREYALRALYEWQVAGNAVAEIRAGVDEDEKFAQADERYFRTLVHGVTAAAPELDALLAPSLDRPAAELSPVEHAILLLGAYELRDAPDVPYRVVINEAVELAKSYGGTDGYKYVNGVLDKLALRLRPAERAAH